MKQVLFGTTGQKVPAVVVGCMRFGEKTEREIAALIHAAAECGAVFFDHADLYAGGKSEERFGQALKNERSVSRESIILQSKCGIREGYYDSSREHILNAVNGSLKRLQTDYLDVLLIHRPDALCEPEEIAEAFRILKESGKVRYFGVSNHNPGQIELLKRATAMAPVADQLQFSPAAAGMVASGLEVNMETAGSAVRDGGILDYCRLNNVTIQAWSPFQAPNWEGCFLQMERYAALNEAIGKLAEQYQTTPTAVAAAWIFRHPAQMQVVIGTTRPERIREVARASELELSRKEWYDLYRAAGHIIP